MALATRNFLTCSLPAVNTVIAKERLSLWCSRIRPTRAKLRAILPLLETRKRVILRVTAPGIGRVSSGRNGDESHRTLSLRSNQLRGRDRPDPGQDLPLHRLSNPHRHRFSHERVELAGHLCSSGRDTEDLRQDRRKREQAGACVLPRMRHTDLFDGPRCQPRVLWPAGGRARPPRRAASDTAGLVPLGAAVVDGYHRYRALRAPTIASTKIPAANSRVLEDWCTRHSGFSPLPAEPPPTRASLRLTGRGASRA